MLIIGITGTNGAGKGTVVDYLKCRGFDHYSVGEYLHELVKKAGWEENRESLIRMGNELRQKNGSGYIAEQLYEMAAKGGKNAIIESIRTEGEVEMLRSKGKFFLLGVDADRKLRYDRIQERKSIKDNLSFEEFCNSEDGEARSEDPNKQNLMKCMQLADFKIENNGSLEELNIQIEEFIKFIEK